MAPLSVSLSASGAVAASFDGPALGATIATLRAHWVEGAHVTLCTAAVSAQGAGVQSYLADATGGISLYLPSSALTLPALSRRD